MVHILLAVIYLSFISLGLPDSLLGAAWPMMYGEFGVPVSYAGIISMIISGGTIISSLQSDRLTRKLGAGLVTGISVAMTAVALFGFSISSEYWMLVLWAVPYGLGAGSVDASLNNYVALHYASRHMSWLHCMWGVGASVGPYIMGYALSGGHGWNMGYRYIAVLQIGLTVILMLSLPLWKRRPMLSENTEEAAGAVEPKNSEPEAGSSDAGVNGVTEEGIPPLTLPEIIRIPGAKQVMTAFFCYCGLETTAGLWASSYLVLKHGISAEAAAGFAGMFFLGITIGRAISGFMTMKFNDTTMIRIGQSIIAVGILAILLPMGSRVAIAGLVLTGLGCAPVYPCIIHSTPAHFGADKSQAVIGVQMASAYLGSLSMPPLFGLIANHISVAWFPVFMLVILAVMVWMHEKLVAVKA